ncbi:proton-coupled folate transporter isoform X3 [Octopus sinensis]|uniref:Proton-coupled folate transporter isoform X3 n=1 Tax=Octopus sinensis TaxID=2607531 RepID=A0A7E6EY10_9MOLL|nr:proton-coupled folate transporter isoform X3 [Octopus sinensis]
MRSTGDLIVVTNGISVIIVKLHSWLFFNSKMPPIKTIVEPILFLYMFTQFMNAAVFQSLFYSRICLKNFNASICSVLGNGSFTSEENYVQGQTSNWILYCNVVLLIPSTFVSFFFGPFSDKVSRKIVIILPIIGNVLLFCVCALVSYLENVPIAYILLGYFLSGLLGGYIGMLMAILSYATHVTDIKFRTIRIGIVESMIFFSGTIGVFLSGILLKYIGFVWIYVLMAGCCIVALIYCIIVIEDINTSGESFSKNLLTIFKIQHFKDLISFITKPRNSNVRIVLFLSVVIIGVMMFLIMGENDINLLYLRHSPISATITEVGYFSALESAVRGVSLIVFLPLLKKFLNPNDFFLCIAGLISRAASSVTLALVRVKSVIYFVPFISLFIGFSSVAMRGVCSSFVLKEEQGKLFTIISCLQNITSLIASITFNEIYSATVAIDPGICYYGSAGISITLVCLSLFLWRRHNMIKSYVLLQESEIPAPGET